ncbi:DinB family protein [Candidatus Villigracilis saccharophilus]|uniref:DinB family protein n=1 Tax=Candidatus Villigracilis saccharophilus TaxID=3140684 RepID=UPI00313641C0|nr:DinB family protein [Anaerolineales bacterium]
MTLTLLLDLDDTLLDTNLDSFIPAYFQALAKYLTPQVAPEKMFRALISGMRSMSESEDFSRTLAQVFYDDFYSQINVQREELDFAIEKFYDNIFPTLSTLTAQKHDAKPFVDWAFAQGFRIAIATDPLLPRKATHHRLRWAGFEPEQFEIVSTFDHFHFSKTHPAYYAEMLGRMGWPEGPVLMVGNDMERDILPAQKLGLATYHIDSESASSPSPETGARGKLQDLRPWLESSDLSFLIPSFKTVDSILGILAATPAVLNGFSYPLDTSSWTHEPTSEDWSLTELVCHLRDTEREIHHMQIKPFKEQSEPFIPRPDTSIWASQRDYLHEDGRLALAEFNDARRELLVLLKNIEVDEWGRKARHAIFGPTDFLEVVGFIAEHDRMHIQQAWNTLKNM